jgi:DNA (cytosine-5)-methyltransferase 1
MDRAGMGTVFQVEIEPYARQVLERHWPGVLRLRDVREAGRNNLPRCDVLSLGYPCQNLSTANTAGTRTGLSGEKSGLWTEGLRIIRELRPTVAVVENIAKAWREWVPVVRRDFWALGYASVPVFMRADALGAPHPRARVFVVAHADGDGESVRAIHAEASRLQATTGLNGHWRTPPPGGFRLDDGFPRGVGGHQLRAYGNAAMPQMAEILGRAIVATWRPA